MPRVVHFEVHAADPRRAMGFYGTVFDWRFQKFGENDYWLITTGPEGTPGINGGLSPRKDSGLGDTVIAFVCTIDVPDLEATLKTVEAAGGKIVVQPSEIPGVGRFAYAKDTEGNIFGMMQNYPRPG